jgi:Rod binding domain-containing protein
MPLTGPVGADAGPGAPTAQKIAELSQEFESMMLLQLIKQMRQSMVDPDEEGTGFGMETMTETVDLELARHLSRHGGIGLAEVMQEHFARQLGTDPRSEGAPIRGLGESVPVRSVGEDRSVRSEDTTRAVRVTEAAVTLPLAVPVSSPFGWRQDPFDGSRRFHGGVDLPAAYGRPVPAAAEGRVVSAGEQGGFGLTVLVEHPGGLQSRYAHLAAVEVKSGDHVEAGQVIGRVGQTGRATGPHLHFELLRDGRRLDPSRAVHEVAISRDEKVE